MLIRATGAGIAAAFLFAACGPSAAQSPEPAVQMPDVVASVNGDDISSGELQVAAEAMRSELEPVPEQYRGAILLDVLVNQRLFAAVARDAGVEDSDAFKRRLRYYTTKALRDSYVETVLINEISEDEVEARYTEEIAKLPETEEVRARHILVDTKAEAHVLSEMARKGADFAELAMAHSTGPSAPDGGDLGYFTSDRMLPAFSEAAFALDVGGISDPVQTDYGWHVIKVEDRRLRPPPELDVVRDQMTALVLRDKIRERTVELRKGADIEILGNKVEDEPADAGADEQGEDGAAQ